ncbi:hypothetical protein FOCC_FOCC013219 [Frankliniella occidentalis]|nr:hypothetical protein FOCC_FOCC013219 [Frankliniella occidentalis]
MSDLEYIHWLQELKLITDKYRCSPCGVEMALGKKRDVTDGEGAVEIMVNEFEPLGGPGKIVEIDESLVGKRKYNRGKKKVSQQWVFGGVEQGSNKCFLYTVKKRDTATLVPLIKKNILPGTTIYSDCWKAYSSLNKKGYHHLTVNHSVTFKDGEVCTNTIEGMWQHVKRIFPKCNRRKAMFDSYLGEFMFRKKFVDEDLFVIFLEKISKVYKPKSSDSDDESGDEYTEDEEFATDDEDNDINNNV